MWEGAIMTAGLRGDDAARFVKEEGSRYSDKTTEGVWAREGWMFGGEGNLGMQFCPALPQAGAKLISFREAGANAPTAALVPLS
jgi:hypothetical protein